MHTASALMECQNKGGFGSLSDLRGVVGLPSRREATDVSASAHEVFRNVRAVLDDILKRAIAKRTGADFEALRDEVFHDYLSTTVSLSSLMKVMVPAKTLDRLVWETFTELEGDLREQGARRFGVAARDQAIFIVFTLRKINSLVEKVNQTKPREDCLAEDKKIAHAFAFHLTWTQFHLCCMIAAIRFDEIIWPEVLEQIIEGLRSAVNAYGLLREGFGLREQPATIDLKPYDWDEEDTELLASSMSDMESDAIDGY